MNKLTQEEIVKMMQEKPFSTKAKRTIVWVDKKKDSDEVLNRYDMTPDDREILREYLKDNLENFEIMLDRLSANKAIHPWERSLPLFKKYYLKLAKYLVLTIYVGVCFVLIQLALFNLILLGLMLLYLFKFADLFTAMIIKAEVKYQNKDFIAYLKKEEEKYSKSHNIKLTGGI